MKYLVAVLSDMNGAEYLGVNIPHDVLIPYLAQLKSHLEGDFLEDVGNRAKRDGEHHHVTIIRPMEWTSIIKDGSIKSTIGSSIEMSFLGLGAASNGSDVAYFVIAESDDIQRIRARNGLQPLHPHLTLGFYKSDVHDVPKGLSTRI